MGAKMLEKNQIPWESDIIKKEDREEGKMIKFKGFVNCITFRRNNNAYWHKLKETI